MPASHSPDNMSGSDGLAKEDGESEVERKEGKGRINNAQRLLPLSHGFWEGVADRAKCVAEIPVTGNGHKSYRIGRFARYRP